MEDCANGVVSLYKLPFLISTGRPRNIPRRPGWQIWVLQGKVKRSLDTLEKKMRNERLNRNLARINRRTPARTGHIVSNPVNVQKQSGKTKTRISHVLVSSGRPTTSRRPRLSCTFAYAVVLMFTDASRGIFIARRCVLLPESRKCTSYPVCCRSAARRLAQQRSSSKLPMTMLPISSITAVLSKFEDGHSSRLAPGPKMAERPF